MCIFVNVSNVSGTNRQAIVDRVAKISIGIHQSVREVAQLIDQSGEGVAAVVDAVGRLLDVVTDGDLRRASLDNVALEASIGVLLAHKHATGRGPPIVCAPGEAPPIWRRLMIENDIRHLPIVDNDGQLRGLVTWFDLAERPVTEPLRAVIMAGGLGTRLRPITNEVPKPMLEVGGRPILERIVASLNKVGIKDLVITTHYLPERIRSHFGDGDQFGVRIEYVHEPSPRGTAGALSFVETANQPTIVINGDIVTDLNFRALVDFHVDHNAALTVSVADYVMRVPYGVVEHNGVDVTGISEKPQFTMRINAGIYVVSPEVMRLVPAEGHFDMTDLVEKLRQLGLKVACFPIREEWLDIGRPEDLQRAQLLAS